ncbi:MAG: hypothetical protein GY943_30420 [Chloroflexi bacterium]|nr:hypothetical protein [Chloroflexota bacterium]
MSKDLWMAREEEVCENYVGHVTTRNEFIDDLKSLGFIHQEAVDYADALQEERDFNE